MRALGKRRADSAQKTLRNQPDRVRSIAAGKCGEWAAQVLLLANAEFLDYVLVALGIVVLQVVEQAASLADHHQETAAGGVILIVCLEMVRQLTDPFAKHRDLNLRTPGIFLVGAVSGNDVLFTLSS